jgi:putative MFS transporter
MGTTVIPQAPIGVTVGTPSSVSEQPINRKYMWTVLFCGTSGMLFDGLDVMIFAMVAPWIMRDWKLTTVQVGLIGSLFLIGHSSGSFLSAVLADRVGRKPLFVITPLFYSIFTSMTGLVSGVYSMGALRALTGLGTGGVYPVCISMVGENVPPKTRG